MNNFLNHKSSEQVKSFFELKNQNILAAIKKLILICRDSAPAFPAPEKKCLFVCQTFSLLL